MKFQLSKISDLNKGNTEGKTLQFSIEFIRVKSYVNDESTGGECRDQGSQTRGPRAVCGPPNAFVRPVNFP